ncbi:aspartic peptidase domain-containing protein [Parachaetomium inaequale]|uniref:Aspartic peptidase domain-containing protein n=1 Tax=Parachaetomium inaequale TaxID=2588326 RepID=A0AAN6PBT9_9PEZI|nr:aspartic peptidase domain-containing protein [Parachaetomium inaequale]
MRLLHLLVPVAAAAAETMQVAWTTDNGAGQRGAYGPDGPWQAIAVRVGNYSKMYSQPDGFGGEFAALWPSGGAVSKVLTRAAGGNYTTANSSTAAVTQVDMANWDDWMSGVVMNEYSRGVGVFDMVTLPNKMAFNGEPDFRTNATLLAVDNWMYWLPDGSNYSASVGILALGLPTAISPSVGQLSRGILQELKSQGGIASTSHGLHMGSVALEQPGSLVLGGYERNRALGSVGIFNFDPLSLPTFFLLDVFLGIQVGASPFTKPEDVGSLWQGIGDDEAAENLNKEIGFKAGTAIVIPNPEAPYIYLPSGNCEAAASRLPVTWNARLGLYLWNTDDPVYQRIVRSPAYLGFVFADRTATNITIKVPFHLLNLTPEPPLMPRPTPYFPCKARKSSSGYWMLGRAFLQAAFFGVNLERNVTYLAQAPGPAMEQSVVQTLRSDDETPQTNPIEDFERSWLPSWTVLQEADAPSSSETPSSSPSAEPSSGGNGALSMGSIVGIVVGVVAALAAAAVAAWIFWRRKAKAKATESAPSGTGDAGGWAVSAKGVTEMDGQGNIAELGKPNAHEMWSPPVTHELPTDEFARHEFPSHDLPTHGLPSPDFPVTEGQGGYDVPRPNAS